MASSIQPGSIWEQSGRSLQYRNLASCWRQCRGDCPGHGNLGRLAEGYQTHHNCLPGNWPREIQRRETIHRLAQLQLAEMLAGLAAPPRLSYDRQVPYGFRGQWDRGQDLWLTPADPGYCLNYRARASHGRKQWFSQQDLDPNRRLITTRQTRPLLVFVPGTNLVLANPADWRKPTTISWSRADSGQAPTPIEISSLPPIDRWPTSAPVFRQLLCWLISGDLAATAGRHHILARPETATALPSALTDNFTVHCYQRTRAGCLAVKPQKLAEAA